MSRHRRHLVAALLAAVFVAALATPAAAADTMVVRAYFLLDGEGGSSTLVPVLRTVPRATGVAGAAVRELLRGPSSAERTATPRVRTTIPAGVTLRSVAISSGLATVDLSGRFDDGGGSTSMMGRLAQLTYTLTQFPTVTRVNLRLDGRAVTVFSAEGIVLDRPMTRAMFYDGWLPSIWVDRPAYRAALPDPARITGLANVFEATFRIAILDGRRRVLVDRMAMATCGTGCWGRFDVTLRYSVSRAQWGWLRVYNLSAMDGSPEAIRDYPVWLTP